MNEKIISKPLTETGRRNFDRIFGVDGEEQEIVFNKLGGVDYEFLKACHDLERLRRNYDARVW